MIENLFSEKFVIIKYFGLAQIEKTLQLQGTLHLSYIYKVVIFVYMSDQNSGSPLICQNFD